MTVWVMVAVKHYESATKVGKVSTNPYEIFPKLVSHKIIKFLREVQRA